MLSLDAQLEALLFISGEPIKKERLTEALSLSPEELDSALASLAERLREGSGLRIVQHDSTVGLVTHPEAAEAVCKIIKQTNEQELSNAALETLTILSYRGPLTRPELEQIRGVQSSIILRNLMIRGLVEEREDTRLGQAIYQVTLDFLRHLGIEQLSDLPDYATLHAHPTVETVLESVS